MTWASSLWNGRQHPLEYLSFQRLVAEIQTLEQAIAAAPAQKQAIMQTYLCTYRGTAMQTNPTDTAHHLYALYETLPLDTRQAFLKELFQKQREQLEDLSLYLACQQAREENAFLTKDEADAFINDLPQ